MYSNCFFFLSSRHHTTLDQAKLDKKRERNRIAASKCRQRKLEKIQSLGTKLNLFSLLSLPPNGFLKTFRGASVPTKKGERRLAFLLRKIGGRSRQDQSSAKLSSH